ncbi:hypothetical protein ABW20_dc0100434 [Dactylellina cionopaga]|nr:hypothetical protein ABW20_dc0100434 [Dactylellina cionopaga]
MSPPTIISHRHRVHFTLCHHTFRKYVFEPDPEDPSRCICPKIDKTVYPVEETVPGRSGVILNCQFELRTVRGRCKVCKEKAEEQLAALQSVEDPWSMESWSAEATADIEWNQQTENWEAIVLPDSDEPMPDAYADGSEERNDTANENTRIHDDQRFPNQ